MRKTAVMIALLLVLSTVLCGCSADVLLERLHGTGESGESASSESTKERMTQAAAATEAAETEPPAETPEPETPVTELAVTEAETKSPAMTAIALMTEAETTAAEISMGIAPTRSSTSDFHSATASSTLDSISAQSGVYTYTASNVLDGKRNTCWSEGMEGSGTGEFIMLYASRPVALHYISMMNGLCTDRETFYKNGRVRECEILLSDGSSLYYTLSGEFDDQPCVLEMPEGVSSDTVTIRILSVYEGSDYADTCISEITVE